MVMTNVGKSGTALLWTVSGTRPDFISIGTGSAAVLVTDTDLVTEATGAAFTSTTLTTAQQVTWIADYSAGTMSGIELTEFGVKISGLNVWNREGFAAISFDGSNELQIQVTFQTF